MKRGGANGDGHQKRANCISIYFANPPNQMSNVKTRPLFVPAGLAARGKIECHKKISPKDAKRRGMELPNTQRSQTDVVPSSPYYVGQEDTKREERIKKTALHSPKFRSVFVSFVIFVYCD
jgi:hypothetical protein